MAGSHTLDEANEVDPTLTVTERGHKHIKKPSKRQKAAVVKQEEKADYYNGVNVLDEPSAKWGWHRIPNSVIQIAGWLSVILLIAYNFGNHEGHVETIYLVVLTVVIALGLVIFAIKPELKQVTKVTANNQPVGHQEPNWTYDQLHMTGAYANLSDGQMRAMNVDPASVVRHDNRIDRASGAANLAN